MLFGSSLKQSQPETWRLYSCCSIVGHSVPVCCLRACSWLDVDVLSTSAKRRHREQAYDARYHGTRKRPVLPLAVDGRSRPVQVSLSARLEAVAGSKYKFGTGTADFHVCSRCVVPFVASNIDDRLYAVVNVNTLQGETVSRQPASFDAEDVEARLRRRKDNWIPDD